MTPESQQRIKEEAKALSLRIDALIKDTDKKDRMIRLVSVYAGILTETLIEYEEPDIVMEQAFFRIADLLRADPAEVIDEGDLIPLAWTVDYDTELGRHLARGVAKRLPRGLDDAHEIAIALMINAAPDWEKEGFPKDITLRLLVELVIMSLTFEMATQDFCDLMIEEFITDGRSAGDAVLGLGAIAGEYFATAKEHYVMPPDADKRLTEVMARESRRHETPGTKNWETLAAANDTVYKDLPKNMEKLKPEIAEFFELVGLDDALASAVCVAKAAGRMVAVVTVEDIGQIHPSIAKSLAKTGMILGSKSKEQAKV